MKSTTEIVTPEIIERFKDSPDWPLFVFDKCGCIIPRKKTRPMTIKDGCRDNRGYRTCIEHPGSRLVSKLVKCPDCGAVVETCVKARNVRRCPVCHDKYMANYYSRWRMENPGRCGRYAVKKADKLIFEDTSGGAYKDEKPVFSGDFNQKTPPCLLCSIWQKGHGPCATYCHTCPLRIGWDKMNSDPDIRIPGL